MGTARKNFSDAVRAAAYVRDLATCCYSGKTLWIADFGADPHFAIDWAEHDEPAARGGSGDLDNALTAAWNYNWMRGDSAKRPPVLFYNGRPTEEGFCLLGSVPDAVFAHLRRMASLRPSDWFFNRALWHVWLGTLWLLNQEDGYKESRDTAYRAHVALGMLAKWRRAAAREGTSHPEARGLVPRTPSPDQELLWAVHEQTDVTGLEEVMRKLLPHMRANRRLLDRLPEIEDSNAAHDLLADLGGQRLVSPIVRARVQANVDGLLSLFGEVIPGTRAHAGDAA